MIARPGWARRFYRVLYVAFEFVVLMALVFGPFVLIWLMAPKGAVPGE